MTATAHGMAGLVARLTASSAVQTPPTTAVSTKASTPKPTTSARRRESGPDRVGVVCDVTMRPFRLPFASRFVCFTPRTAMRPVG